MGSGPARSPVISAIVRCWAAVSGNGSRWWKAVTRSAKPSEPSPTPLTRCGMPVAVASRSRLRSTSESWMRSNSSKTRRLRAASMASMASGPWMSVKARVRPVRSQRARTSAGTGSANSPARSRTSPIHRLTSQVVSRSFSDWG